MTDRQQQEAIVYRDIIASRNAEIKMLQSELKLYKEFVNEMLEDLSEEDKLNVVKHLRK